MRSAVAWDELLKQAGPQYLAQSFSMKAAEEVKEKDENAQGLLSKE